MNLNSYTKNLVENQRKPNGNKTTSLVNLSRNYNIKKKKEKKNQLIPQKQGMVKRVGNLEISWIVIWKYHESDIQQIEQG